MGHTVGEIRVRLGSITRIFKMASTGRGGSSRTRQSSFAFRLINPELFIKPVSTLSFLSQMCRQLHFPLSYLLCEHSGSSRKRTSFRLQEECLEAGCVQGWFSWDGRILRELVQTKNYWEVVKKHFISSNDLILILANETNKTQGNRQIFLWERKFISSTWKGQQN